MSIANCDITYKGYRIISCGSGYDVVDPKCGNKYLASFPDTEKCMDLIDEVTATPLAKEMGWY